MGPAALHTHHTVPNFRTITCTYIEFQLWKRFRGGAGRGPPRGQLQLDAWKSVGTRSPKREVPKPCFLGCGLSQDEKCEKCVAGLHV